MGFLPEDMAALVGYGGSALIALSMMMGNIWRLRWINLAGATVMAVYGLAIASLPVFCLNVFIVSIDIFHIVELSRRYERFSILPFPDRNYPYLTKFLAFYEADIRRYQPEFKLEHLAHPKGFFILRNMVSVGLFVYQEEGDAIRIHLDYVVPDYRDLKNAHFAYDKHVQRFLTEGFTQAITESHVPQHQRYLKRVGFSNRPEEPHLFTRTFTALS
jgi:hypothetical protein